MAKQADITVNLADLPQIREAMEAAGHRVLLLEQENEQLRERIRLLEGRPVDCAAVWPTTAQDVLPVRCRLETDHDGGHWHPPLWPATPDVVWVDE
jgi:hypothetical protein